MSPNNLNDSFDEFPKGATKTLYDNLMENLNRKKTMMVEMPSNGLKWSSLVYEEAFGTVDLWMKEEKVTVAAERITVETEQQGGPFYKNTKIPLQKPADFNWSFFDFQISSGNRIHTPKSAKCNRSVVSKPIRKTVSNPIFTSTQLSTPENSALQNFQASPILKDKDDDFLDTSSLLDLDETVEIGKKKTCSKRLFDKSTDTLNFATPQVKKKKVESATVVILDNDENDEFSPMLSQESEYSPSNESVLEEQRTKRNNKKWSSSKNKWRKYEKENLYLD